MITQVAILRALSRRRREGEQWRFGLPFLTATVNLFFLGYSDRAFAPGADPGWLAWVMLAEGLALAGAMLALAASHIQPILDRTELTGLRPTDRIHFLLAESASHPVVAALGGSMVLAGVVLNRHSFQEALAAGGVLAVWWGCTVVISAALLLASRRARIAPEALAAGAGVTVFLLATGTSTGSGTLVRALPPGAWAAAALQAIPAGPLTAPAAWTAPTVALALGCYLYARRTG